MNLPKPLSCSDVSTEQVLKALVNHKLDSATEDLVLEHLKKCPSCLTRMAEVLFKARFKAMDNCAKPSEPRHDSAI